MGLKSFAEENLKRESINCILLKNKYGGLGITRMTELFGMY